MTEMAIETDSDILDFLVSLKEKADIPKLFGENKASRLNRIKAMAEKRKMEYQKLKDIGSPYQERRIISIELDLLREMYADTLKMKPLTNFFPELENGDLVGIEQNGFYDFYKNNFLRFIYV